MNQLLLELPLRRNRDLLLARQRGRQIAGLLGFGPAQQIRIAAGVFEIAGGAAEDAVLRFSITEEVFRVVAVPAAALRLEMALPGPVGKLDLADLVWAVRELDQDTPLEVRDEMRRQNQELLLALVELEKCRALLARGEVAAAA
jgi:hypothetical protein